MISFEASGAVAPISGRFALLSDDGRSRERAGRGGAVASDFGLAAATVPGDSLRCSQAIAAPAIPRARTTAAAAPNRHRSAEVRLCHGMSTLGAHSVCSGP